MDQDLVWLIPTDIGLNAPRGQPAVGRQFLPGDGVITVMLRHFRQGELQQRVLMEGEVVDLDVVEILLSIGPVGTLSDFRESFQQMPKAPYW